MTTYVEVIPFWDNEEHCGKFRVQLRTEKLIDFCINEKITILKIIHDYEKAIDYATSRSISLIEEEKNKKIFF